MDENGPIKVVACLALIAGGLVPGLLSKFKPDLIKYSKIAPYLTTFAGGFFLVSGLMQLLPEGSEALHDDVGLHKLAGPLLAALGYCLFFGVEKAILKLSGEMLEGHAGQEYEVETGRETNRTENSNRSIKGVAIFMQFMAQGIAIALDQTIAGIIGLTLTSLIYGAAIGAILGIYFKDESKTSSIILLSMFSAIAPLTIVAFIILKVYIDSPFIEGALLSICVGGFLYVASNEIVPVELRTKAEKTRIKFGVFLVAVVLYMSYYMGTQ